DEVKQIPFQERPKYGTIVFKGDKEITDGAVQYGEVAIVLDRNKLKDRISFTPFDSAMGDSTAVGTPNSVGALARNERALRAAGFHEEFVNRNHKASPQYNEIQIWGNLNFDSSTVKKIRVPKINRYTRDSNEVRYKDLIEHCKSEGIEVEIVE